MQVDELPTIDSNVDYTQILPIDQKRTVAFVNHFIMNTVSFLNKFAQSCESRFMEFEYKLQKIEASLLILESQLSSISGLNVEETPSTETVSVPEHIQKPTVNEEDKIVLPEIVEVPPQSPAVAAAPLPPEVNAEEVGGVKASQDVRFKKFFKMVQFGVPETAVKLKMKVEGIDPNILDTPNAVIPGAVPDVEHNLPPEDSDSSAS